MKAISRAIDKFCIKHRNFGIPRLMLYVVAISAVVYLIGMIEQSPIRLLNMLSFHPSLILRGQVWRLVSWVFLQSDGNIIFTAIMLYFYYFIGSTLEREWGAAKFTIFYISGVMLNIIYGFIMWIIMGSPALFGVLSPNFLNLSLFFAFAVLFPNHRIMLFFLIPVKIKWLAWLSAAFMAYETIRLLFEGRFAMAVLPIVAILNFLLICGYDLRRNINPVISAKSAKRTVDFKRAAKKVQRQQNSRSYRHKCAVCGKTDVDNPGLEFRYCSRCNGYHCFCIDHINNHVHF